MIKKPNYVLVLDANKNPLIPCKPSLAKKLLKAQKAAVYRRFPFTLILKKECTVNQQKLEIKLDPGSQTTGISLVLNDALIWCAELNHRGSLIKQKLESRRQYRRLRRSRLRYRKPRFDNRQRAKEWLAPSLEHRVLTTMTIVRRLIKFAPKGELLDYEIREYLLEKWERKCTYCSQKDIPLQIEHIVPKSKNGSNRLSNLCLACEKCNRRKGVKSIEQFLAKNPSLLKSILVQAKKPLHDAAAINATRWKLFNTLKETGLTILTGTGGQTKFNRSQFGLEKNHFYDAACVGKMDKLEIFANQPLIIICKGQGGRQKAALNKYGYPIRYNPLKPIKGWQSGDLAVDLEGNLGRVNPRSQSNSFNFTIFGQKAKSIHVNKLRRVHQKDGYSYAQ
jgi:5-methylcytosine-specific restriction endonuclease McrA